MAKYALVRGSRVKIRGDYKRKPSKVPSDKYKWIKVKAKVPSYDWRTQVRSRITVVRDGTVEDVYTVRDRTATEQLAQDIYLTEQELKALVNLREAIYVRSEDVTDDLTELRPIEDVRKDIKSTRAKLYRLKAKRA